VPSHERVRTLGRPIRVGAYGPSTWYLYMGVLGSGDLLVCKQVYREIV